MARKSLAQTIKSLFKGGKSSSGSSPIDKIRKSSKSYYGGGYSSSYRSYTKQREEDEKERQRKKLAEQNKQATANLAAIAKISQRTDALSSGKKSLPPEPKTLANNGVERAVKKIGEKAKVKNALQYIGNDTERQTIDAIKKWNDSNKQQKKEFNERTNHKYDVKYWEEKGDKKKAQEARIRVKSGENASDIVAEELAVKYHPTAYSATRGAASGATFGLSELAIKSQAKHDKERAKNEQYYQEHKNKTAETVGELAGAFTSFGLTSPATDALAAKAIGKVAPNAAGRLAESRLIKGAATRAVDRAVERGLVEAPTKELISQFGKSRATKIINALGNDIIQNLTTGALYDLTSASANYEVGTPEWWKELGRSAAFNTLITGGVAGFNALGGGRRLMAEAIENTTKKQTVEKAVRDLNERGVRAGNLPQERGRLFGESIDERIARGRNVDLKAAEEVVDNATPRIEAIDRELDELYNRIAHSGDMSEEALSSLIKRTNDLKAERAALARSADVVEPPRLENVEADMARAQVEAETAPPRLEEVAAEAPSAEPPKKTKLTPQERKEKLFREADERADNIRAFLGEETEAPRTEPPKPKTEAEPPAEEKSILPSVDERNKQLKEAQEKSAKDLGLEQEYTVKIKRTTKSGKTSYVKKTVTAKSDGEAIAKATARTSNVKSAVVADTKPKAELPPPKAELRPPKAIDDVHQGVGVKREKKSLKDDVKEFVESAKTKFADSLNVFEQYNRQYLKTDHKKWAKNVGRIDKARRYQAIAARSIEEGQMGWNGKVIKDSKSLKQIYDGLDEAAEKDFDLYLLLKHSPTRVDEGKPIFGVIEEGKNFDDPEVAAAEAKKLYEKYLEKGIDFEKKSDDLYKYLRNELQNRVDAGLLPQEIANKWNREHPFYVPTGRDGKQGAGDIDIWDALKEMSEGNVTGAGEIKAASGDNILDSPVRSIKEQIAEATTRNWRDMSMNNLFKGMFDDKVAEALAKEADGGLETVLDNTINLGKSKDGRRFFADVYDGGKKVRIDIDKPFYDAIEDLYKNGRLGNKLDLATDIAAKVARPYKNLITSWSPIFLVKNFLRDFPEAIINTRQTKEFLACMRPAMKDLTENGEWTQALRNSGVSQSNFVNLEEALTKGDKNLLKKGMDKFATLNELTEMYPRLVEFMATVKKAGYDKLSDIPANEYMELIDTAAANAADVTVNFGRSGSVGKMLNRGFIPFLNPSIQGWSKFIRNITEAENGKALLSLVLKATSLGAVPTVINNFLLEDNPNYQMISARDKANNYIIPIPKSLDMQGINSADMFIKIPRSRFASVYGLPAVNIANDNKMGWAEMLKITNDQIAPVDPRESNLLAPFFDTARNETWYGSPIVPQSIENKTHPSEEYDANTSYIGRALGKATEKLPKQLQISPKKADYVLDSTFGVAADFVLPALTPSRRNGGNPIASTANAMGNVVKRQFTIDPTTQNDLSTRFYDRLQVASDNKKSIHGSKADAEEYKRLNSYSDELADINDAIRYLQGGKSKTKQDDIYGLQKVRNQLMQDALDGKGAPSKSKTLDAVQKYVGTSYAIDNFGSTADKNAMKIYGEAKYGKLSDEEMAKKIDADKDFYKGVQSIGKLQDKLTEADVKSKTTLSRAVALASSNANDDVFEAYGCKNQSRTESDNKMNRARAYFRSGGSDDEFVQLEKVRTTFGKLTAYDKEEELEKAHDELASGKITASELIERKKAIEYNANISYVGLATSLAQANAPERGYRLYDIKDRNIQKGINLAAMGYTARDYREMVKALDLNGNGYPSRQEVIDYVANSGVSDKATLFDALYSYQGKNPFGSPTNYTRAQAAETGKRNGIESISNESGEFKLNGEQKSSSGWSGYGGRYHYYGHGGGGSSKKAKVPKPKKMGSLKAGEALVSKSSSRSKASVPTLERVEAKIDLPTARYSKKNRG